MAQCNPALLAVLEGRAPGPPAARHLGWRCIELDAENGTLVVEFQPRAEFLNPIGNVQGGFLAAMLDDTMGPLVFATLEPGQFNPTLEFKVSFLRPARLGPLTATARIVHRGRSIAFAAADLRDAGGELLATATATMKIVSVAAGEDAGSGG
jgi:uncharacterized protein (TIGR00369 family)